MNTTPLYSDATSSLSIHPSVDTWADCITNAREQAPLSYDFTSLGNITRSDMAGPLGRCIFRLLRSPHTVLYIFLHLHSCQQCVRGSLFSTSSPALVLLDNNHCNHSESLPPGSCGFYSVMVNEVELLFLYFSAICISSSEKCLSVPFAPFLTRGCLASCCWVFEVAWILVHGQADSLHILSSILPGVCVVAHFLSCAEASLMQSHLFLLPMPVGSCPSHLIMGKAAQNALDRGQPVSSINGAGKTRHL